MRLSPHDPQLGIWEYHHGLADLGLGHSAEAVDEERRAIDDGFGTYWPHQALAAAYALLGRDNEAKAELGQVRSPQSSRHLNQVVAPLSNIPRLIDGLRKAGMPEE